MNVKDKKQVMLALIVIVFLFVFFMLLGYFYTSNRNNSKRAYVLEEHYVETNNVYLNSSFPVSDALGKVYKGDADDAKQVLKEFTYKNEYSTDINYQVYLKKNSKCSGNNEIGNEFVNLYLTDSNDNALNGFTNNIFTKTNIVNEISKLTIVLKSFVLNIKKITINIII